MSIGKTVRKGLLWLIESELACAFKMEFVFERREFALRTSIQLFSWRVSNVSLLLYSFSCTLFYEYSRWIAEEGG